MIRNIVTIDGPAASGKSSVSRELAKKLRWKWVSTGAFYRGLAYVATQENIATDNIQGLVDLAAAEQIWRVRMDADTTRVFYKGQDVTPEIGREDNGTRASEISQIPQVREALLKNQRDCSTHVPGLVAEGRDCGTVVFPQAEYKVYLTASQEERAARRAKEQGLSVEDTHAQQSARDHQDSSRAAAPLAIPENAKVIDSNGMALAQVVEEIYKWVSR